MDSLAQGQGHGAQAWLEDEGQPGFLAKFVSKWRTATKDGDADAVWRAWRSLRRGSKEDK